MQKYFKDLAGECRFEYIRRNKLKELMTPGRAFPAITMRLYHGETLIATVSGQDQIQRQAGPEYCIFWENNQLRIFGPIPEKEIMRAAVKINHKWAQAEDKAAEGKKRRERKPGPKPGSKRNVTPTVDSAGNIKGEEI